MANITAIPPPTPARPTSPATSPVSTVLLGLAVNFLLAAGKLTAGILGHSSALVADAIESFSDCVGTLVTLQGVRVAHRPPDANHPYGHGKAEAVAALVVCVLLVVAAGIIATEAARELLVAHAAPAWWTLLVLGGVIAVKETIFRVMARRAAAHASVAVATEAWHHRADAITSATGFVGIAVAIFGPRLGGPAWLVGADEVAALVATCVIVFVAFKLSRAPLHELLDEEPADLTANIRRLAAACPGVVEVETVHARKSGPGYLVDMHLHVDGALPLVQAHALGGAVRAHIRALDPRVRDVLIHLEPARALATTPVHTLPPAPAPQAAR